MNPESSKIYNSESCNTQEHSDLCLQCLECCKILTFEITIPVFQFANTVKFYEARGCEVKTAGGKFYVVVNYPCPNLTAEGCRIYSTRPNVCRQYDGRLHPLMAPVCKWSTWSRKEIS